MSEKHEFKAEIVDGKIVVKPIVIKTPNEKGGVDVRVIVPEISKIVALKHKFAQELLARSV